jgi:hypothetical protein
MSGLHDRRRDKKGGGVDKKWEVDDATTVNAHFGFFGKKSVSINGKAAYISRKMTSKREIAFAMPDGRSGAVSIKPQFIGAPEIALRVGGQLVAETTKDPIKCPACNAAAKPYDRFCGKCGKPMPSAEDVALRKNVKQATGAIKILAALFVVSGIAFFFITKGQADAFLPQLEGMDPAATYPKAIGGRMYTVEELRRELTWEPWGVLIVNLILAVTMVALALWAKRAPLAAVLVATATYIVVIVAGGIMDPASLAQGWIIKLVIIAFLIKGIKAALALRSARA